METLSPDHDDQQDAPKPKTAQRLRTKWIQYVVKGVQQCLKNNIHVLTLSDPFSVEYSITQWPWALKHAIEAYLETEQYEDCALCQDLIKQTHIRILTLTEDELEKAKAIERRYQPR